MKKIKYIFLGIIAAFLVAEILLRLVLGLGNPPIFEASEDYGYRFKPNQNIQRFGNRIYFNSKGLRSESISDDPEGGVVRILCIGDSITYGGQWVDQDNTYPYILERALNEKERKKFEVLNISAPSWGIQNEEAYLRKHGLYNSDIIVLQLDRGDLFSSKSSSEVVGRSPSYPDKSFTFALEELFVRYLFPEKNIATEKKQSMSAKEVIEDNMQSLQRISELVRKYNAKLMIVYIPNKQEVKGDFFLLQPGSKYFCDTIKRLNILFLNLIDAFNNSGDDNIFRDNVHPNIEGNRVIAESVEKFIIDNLD